MIQQFSYRLMFFIIWLTGCASLHGQPVSQAFEFEFENKTLRGLIEMPKHQKPQALIIIIPGYGKTNFVEGRWFSRLRNHFVGSGLAVCLWDKMGCGKSDGVFDAQQPVGNSADEALAAIQEIKRLKIPGSEKIGLWGLSRAGWICPLINEKFPIDFWISVSGTDDKENFGYLLKSNLLIHGKSEAEAETLFKAWMAGHRTFCTDPSYEHFLNAIRPLTQDSLCRKLFGYTSDLTITDTGRKDHLSQQKQYTNKGHFDKESGLWVYIDHFDTVLLKVKCPVLAIFGEKDSQVDWRKTKALYERTMGKKTDLTIKTFKQCNHNLQKCVTCGWQEDLSALNWQACDGYFEAMDKWMNHHDIIN